MKSTKKDVSVVVRVAIPPVAYRALEAAAADTFSTPSKVLRDYVIKLYTDAVADGETFEETGDE